MPSRHLAYALCLSFAVACGSTDPADTTGGTEAPPDFNAVSNATQCLPNGTVHDPNPPGCERESDCQYSPRTDSNDWADHRYKKQCANTDWMTGVSTGSDRRVNSFRCEMSPYTVSGKSASVGTNRNATVYPSTYPVSNGSAGFDWDPGFKRAECPSDKFVSGIAYTTGTRGTVIYTIDRIRCSLFASVTNATNTNCRAVTFPPNDQPQTSNRESTISGDWDPAPNLMLECGTGSHMVGVSIADDTIHGILCCDGGPSFTPTNSATCCNDNSYNTALTRCLANASSNTSSCSLVDYCCQAGVSSFAGSASCDAAAYAEDPSNEGGTGLITAPESTPAAPTAASGTASYNATIGKVRGNSGFGGGYEASLSLYAAKSPQAANATSKVVASATLFGKNLNLATVSVKGALETQKTTLEMKFLGLDVSPFPINQDGVTYEKEQSKTQTFFKQSRTFTLGPVPVTVEGSVSGTVGIKEKLSFSDGKLVATGGPFGVFNVTASASLGGTSPGFQLTAGIEGSLDLFSAEFAGTITVIPTTANLSCNINSTLTIKELDGKINALMVAKLVTFKKTYRRKLVGFTAATQSKTFLNYNNSITW